MRPMHLRELNVGCFGGGTGLPSLLGGLKSNPWVHADAVVTMSVMVVRAVVATADCAVAAG